jgi:hypothetical protein
MSSSSYDASRASGVGSGDVLTNLGEDIETLTVLAGLKPDYKLTWTGPKGREVISVDARIGAVRAAGNLASSASAQFSSVPGERPATATNTATILKEKIDRLERDLGGAYNLLTSYRSRIQPDNIENGMLKNLIKNLKRHIEAIKKQINQSVIGLQNLARTYEKLGIEPEKAPEPQSSSSSTGGWLSWTLKSVASVTSAAASTLLPKGTEPREYREAARDINELILRLNTLSTQNVGVPKEEELPSYADHLRTASSSSSSSSSAGLVSGQGEEEELAGLTELELRAWVLFGTEEPTEGDIGAMENVDKAMENVDTVDMSASVVQSAMPKEGTFNIYTLMTLIFDNPDHYKDNCRVSYSSKGELITLLPGVQDSSLHSKGDFTKLLTKAFGGVGQEVAKELMSKPGNDLTVADIKGAFLGIAAHVKENDLNNLFNLITLGRAPNPMDPYYQCWTNLSTKDKEAFQGVTDFRALNPGQIAILLKPFRYVPLSVGQGSERRLKYYPTLQAVFRRDAATDIKAFSSKSIRDGELLERLSYANHLMKLNQSTLAPELQYAIGASEHLGKRVCYSDLKEGMIIPCKNQGGEQFFYTVKKVIHDDKEGFFNYILVPTTPADQKILDSSVKDIRLVFRGSDTAGAWQRNFDPEGVGKSIFKHHADTVLGNPEKVTVLGNLKEVLESSPDDVRLSIDGHSLGGCDTQRGLVMVLKAIVDAQNNPESPFHKIKKIVATAHNPPRPEASLNQELLEALDKIPTGKLFKKVREDLEVDLTYVVYQNENLEDVVQKTGTSDAKHIGYSIPSGIDVDEDLSEDLDTGGEKTPFFKRKCVRVTVERVAPDAYRAVKQWNDLGLYDKLPDLSPVYLHSAKAFTDPDVKCVLNEGSPQIQLFQGNDAISQASLGSPEKYDRSTWTASALDATQRALSTAFNTGVRLYRR